MFTSIIQELEICSTDTKICAAMGANTTANKLASNKLKCSLGGSIILRHRLHHPLSVDDASGPVSLCT